MSEQVEKGQSRFKGFGAVFLCTLAAVFEGFDLQVPGVSAPLVSEVFSMTPEDTGFFLSLSTFGMMIGALVGGRLSDSIGRKWVLIGSIAIYSLLTLATVISTSTEMLFWFRFLTGIGLGGALPNIFSLGVESVSKDKRSTAIGLILAGPGIGGAMVSTIAGFTPSPEQWTVIYYAGGLGPLLTIVPLLIFLLPNNKPDPVSAGTAQSAKESMPGIWTTLFGQGRVLLTLAIWLGLLSILGVLFILMSWLPTLMIDRGLSIAEASAVQVAINLSAVPGSILAGVVLDYVLKKRKALTLSLVFLVAIGAIVLLAKGPSIVSIMMLGSGLAGMAVIGGQTMLYALAPVCYPEKGRGTGVGFAVAMGRFGSAGGPLVTGYLVAFGMTSVQVLLSLIPIAAVAGCMTLFITSVKSRENKTLESNI